MTKRALTTRACGTAMGAILLIGWAMAGCAPIDDDPLPEVVLLDIPDVAWDPARPDRSVGWCGEASIQMALAYYGIERTQLEIHLAGNPDYADLYAHEIATALDALRICYERWPEENPDLDAFIAWIREHLAAGVPVFCGVKLFPDEHADWSLDHFVLVVGYDGDGLVMNTQLDMDGRIHVSYADLKSTASPYAFANRWDEYFGRAILGACDE